MREENGSDPERWIGTWIVETLTLSLHPHPDPYYHLYPQSVKDLKDLRARSKKLSINPQDQQYYLEAEIPRADIDPACFYEDTVELMHHKYKKLMLVRKNYSEIKITKGLAFYNLARELGHTWVVIKVYDDTPFPGEESYAQKAAVRSPQFASRELLRLAARNDPNLNKMLSPKTTKFHWIGHEHLRSIAVVCRTKGLVNAFMPLLELDFPWPVMPMSIFHNLRNCWCIEEVENYIRHMCSQWNAITLGIDFNFLDPESLQMLESQAPSLFVQDRNYVVSLFKMRNNGLQDLGLSSHTFKTPTLFPNLVSEPMRKVVEQAVCRQGLMLSLATLTRDLRLLIKKVYSPLRGILGRMRHSNGDTIRRRIEAIFQGEPHRYGSFTWSRGVQSSICARHCYEHVFIHLLEMQEKHMTLDNLLTMDSWKYAVQRKFKARHGLRLFEPSCSLQCSSICKPFRVERSPQAFTMQRYLIHVLFGYSPIVLPHDTDVALHMVRQNRGREVSPRSRLSRRARRYTSRYSPIRSSDSSCKSSSTIYRDTTSVDEYNHDLSDTSSVYEQSPSFGSSSSFTPISVPPEVISYHRLVRCPSSMTLESTQSLSGYERVSRSTNAWSIGYGYSRSVTPELHTDTGYSQERLTSDAPCFGPAIQDTHEGNSEHLLFATSKKLPGTVTHKSVLSQSPDGNKSLQAGSSIDETLEPTSVVFQLVNSKKCLQMSKSGPFMRNFITNQMKHDVDTTFLWIFKDKYDRLEGRCNFERQFMDGFITKKLPHLFPRGTEYQFIYQDQRTSQEQSLAHRPMEKPVVLIKDAKFPSGEELEVIQQNSALAFGPIFVRSKKDSWAPYC